MHVMLAYQKCRDSQYVCMYMLMCKTVSICACLCIFYNCALNVSVCLYFSLGMYINESEFSVITKTIFSKVVSSSFAGVALIIENQLEIQPSQYTLPSQ